MKRRTMRPKPTLPKRAVRKPDWDALEISDMVADEQRRKRRANPSEEVKNLLK